MKNYLQRSNNSSSHPLDVISDAFDNFFKPIFYDEKLDSMKTDIRETENGYEMEVEMPGFDKSDIQLELEDGYLSISARKQEKEESDDKRRYLRKERSVSCQRSYYVGEVKQEQIKAKYNNGVLEICLPKAEPEKPVKNTINID